MKYLVLVFCVFVLCGVVSSKKPKAAPPPPPPQPPTIPSTDNGGWLHILSGQWSGCGFTMMAVPNPDHVFDLKAFHHCETTVYSGVRTGIRNAAPESFDQIFLSSLTYHQQVTDKATGNEIHVESGMWASQPGIPSDATPTSEYWRSGTIPHGVCFIAGSNDIETTQGPPEYDDDVVASPFPFGHEEKRLTGKYVTPYFVNPPIPATMVPYYTDVDGDDDGTGEDDSCDEEAVYGGADDEEDDDDEDDDDVDQTEPPFLQACNGTVDTDTFNLMMIYPPLYLQKDTAALDVVQTIKVAISSVAPGPSIGGVCNIPFLQTFANVSQVEVSYYHLTVDNGDGSYSYYMQYVQEVYINFPITPGGGLITWPHVTVATLKKQAGEFV